MKHVDPDMKEILDTFIAEGYDLLDAVDVRISAIGGEYDPELINGIFRAFHSLKGSSGFLHLENVHALAHTVETLLEFYRSEGRNPDDQVIDAVCRVSDYLRNLLGVVATELSDESAAEESRYIVSLVEQLIHTVSGGEGLSRIGSTVPDSAAASAIDDDADAFVFCENSASDLFAGESLALLRRCGTAFLSSDEEEGGEGAAEDLVEALQTIRDNAELLRFTEVAEQATGVLEFTRELVRDPELADKQVRERLSRQLELLSGLIGRLESGESPEVSGSFQNIMIGEEEEKAASGNGAGGEDVRQKIGEILIEMGEASPEAIEEALTMQSRRGDAAVPAHSFVHRKDVRIETGKLDALLNLTGELITAESMVRQHPDLGEISSPGLRKAVTYLAKVTREIQETAMSMRMIPLEGLFAKMHRIVRDLDRKLDRSLELLISGSDTEMDRSIIEEIADPLVHIIRNAVDHGIEPPAERKAAGKAETGRIELSARYEGSEIWIIVADDGRGLNREKIRKKAVERGLLPDEGQTVPDRELFRLIFEPGFSTSETVTDLSGRGVGMDVVKKNLEKLRGDIDISSTEGRGTRITLKIPLTLAVVSATLARVGTQTYAVPVYSSREFLKVREGQTFTAQGRQCVKIREEIVPIICLHDFFRRSGSCRPVEEGILIVVENNGRKAALLADEIEGYQQVVLKSLTEYIGDPRGISGCSIMGTGDVCFILDAGAVLAAELD